MAGGAKRVAERFATGGAVKSVARLGEGHIHATYEVVVARDGGTAYRFVLQRINRAVFGDPSAVVRNVERVIEHLRSRTAEEGGKPEREVLTLVPARDDAMFVRDEEGEIWRCYEWIERAAARSTVAGPSQARTVARTFGRFLRRMSDFPAHTLEITIAGFHDVTAHLRQLENVVREDPCARAAKAEKERAFIECREDGIAAWMELLACDQVSMRPVHNDTKVSNVLIDQETGEGICVIDLDTVMPGFALVDVGDCIRSAMTGPEAVGRAVDLSLFEAVVRGFLDEAGDLLSAAEVGHIVEATRSIALELGIRFLSDFIAGDRWFPVSTAVENLDRCRAQLELVRGIEEREDGMAGIVCRAAERSRRSRIRGLASADAIRFGIDGGRGYT